MCKSCPKAVCQWIACQVIDWALRPIERRVHCKKCVIQNKCECGKPCSVRSFSILERTTLPSRSRVCLRLRRCRAFQFLFSVFGKIPPESLFVGAVWVCAPNRPPAIEKRNLSLSPRAPSWPPHWRTPQYQSNSPRSPSTCARVHHPCTQSLTPTPHNTRVCVFGVVQQCCHIRTIIWCFCKLFTCWASVPFRFDRPVRSCFLPAIGKLDCSSNLISLHVCGCHFKVPNNKIPKFFCLIPLVLGRMRKRKAIVSGTSKCLYWPFCISRILNSCRPEGQCHMQRLTANLHCAKPHEIARFGSENIPCYWLSLEKRHNFIKWKAQRKSTKKRFTVKL